MIYEVTSFMLKVHSLLWLLYLYQIWCKFETLCLVRKAINVLHQVQNVFSSVSKQVPTNSV